MNRKFNLLKRPTQLSDKVGTVKILLILVDSKGKEIAGNLRKTYYAANTKTSEFGRSLEENQFKNDEE